MQAQLVDPYALSPLPPAPDGELPIRVRCRTARTGPDVRRHDVLFAADWSVRTPHDLDLERIAQAMGGYLSCIDLVDGEAPALRELVQLRARRIAAPIARGKHGNWFCRETVPECDCHRSGYASAAEAAAHVREPLHVARLYGVVPRALQRLLTEVERAYGTGFYVPPPDPDARAAVREWDGIDQLWEAGLHPEAVHRLRMAVWPGGPPLPVLFYLGVLSRRPDIGWLARTLAEVPDEDVAVWLCWTATDHDRQQPTARVELLRAGVPRQAIAALAEGAYSPTDVARLACAGTRSAASAARALAAWHRAGCHPSPEDVAVLDELGVDPWHLPSAAAIDWLELRLPPSPSNPNRTQLGLLLAVCGTRAAALHLLFKGVRDPRDAAALVDPDRRAE